MQYAELSWPQGHFANVHKLNSTNPVMLSPGADQGFNTGSPETSCTVGISAWTHQAEGTTSKESMHLRREHMVVY